MTHYGIVCPPVSGHVNPMAALGRELVARGHRVTCFQLPDLAGKVTSEGLAFCEVGARVLPAGSLAGWLAGIGARQGISALRHTIRAVATMTGSLCEDLPVAVRERGVECLIVDQMEPAGGAVAEHLGIPFVTVCNALPINRSRAVPPPFSDWAYSNSRWASMRNAFGYGLSAWATSPIQRTVADYRKRWRLPALKSPDDSFSPLAQICQMPAALDYPREDLPQTFSYVGPLRRPDAPIAFPWERLDGRPLIYASLGTLQNGRLALFQQFATACEALDVQLVISHAGGLSPDQIATLRGNPLVVPYAPQQQLLSRASLALTHAGLNTVLDAASQGVPVVAVPITYEQPAIARRVTWAGAGRAVALRHCEPTLLRRTITDVLAGEDVREGARRLASSIAAAGGVARAAELIEAVAA